MRKFFKRVLAVVLCAAMCFASVVVSVFAAPVVVPLLKFAATWVVEQIGDELMSTAWNNLQPETVLENKNKFIALLREFAIENKMDYDTAHQWLADCCADWDISLIDKYGDNAVEMYNIMHEPVYQLCNNYIYQCDLSTLATLVTQTDEASPIITDDGKVQVPASVLKDHITTNNNLYYPKNATGKMSYRTDDRWHNSYDLYNDNIITYGGTADLYCGGFGFSAVGGNDMYFVLFSQLGDDYLYGKYQYHLTVTSEDVYYDDRDEVEYTNYTLSYEYWDMLSGSQSQAVSGVLYSGRCDYFDLYLSSSRFDVTAIASYDDYYAPLLFAQKGGCSLVLDDWKYVRSLDIGRSVDLNLSHYNKSLSVHDTECAYGGRCDVGYLASLTPLSITYNVDTTQIPDNYYVTISGDTIYDYSITNPETGQSSTINEYVTNNYTFVTNNGGNNSGTSGNIEVGGKVDVDGKIEFSGDLDVDLGLTVRVPDININVNGGNSSNVSLPDTDFVDDLPEVPQGFIDYLKKLFVFLPAPVLAILIGVIAAAGICRIWGR